MKTDLIVYQISRERIEALDCSHVLTTFDPHTLGPDRLRQLFGRVLFCIQGYDTHPDELYSIPDVRRFVREWHERSPLWLFFGSLQDDSLKIFYMSLLDSLESLQVDRMGLCRVVYDTGELNRLLADDLAHAEALCERLGISGPDRLKRATEVLRYFQIQRGRT